MSAVIKAAEIYIRPMQHTDIEAIIEIERRAYEFPWHVGVFRDCLSVGYCCWVIEREGVLVAYGVMIVAARESHLLNLCVDPDFRQMGLGKRLLNRLLDTALDHNANMTFLEVRPSNFAAIKLYLEAGFNEIGIRRNYYPARIGREDALVFARTAIVNINEYRQK